MHFLTTKNQYYGSIDCMRIVMAILIIAIHTNPQDCINSETIRTNILYFYSLTRVRVSFFFAASGFLIWNGIKDAKKEDKLARLSKWIRKTVKLYIIWTCIYLPFTIYEFTVLKNYGIVKSLIVFFRNFLFIGENYMSWPLWYLLATIVASLMIFTMVKWNIRIKNIYFIAFFFACLGVFVEYLLSNDYHDTIIDLYTQLFRNTRNGFFQGFPNIVIGMAIAQNGILRSKIFLTAMFVLCAIAFAENIELMRFPATYALFSLVLYLNIGNKSTFKKFRLTSIVIYLSHMLFVGSISIIFPNISGAFLFVIAIIGCLVLSLLVISEREKVWVRYLFN